MLNRHCFNFHGLLLIYHYYYLIIDVCVKTEKAIGGVGLTTVLGTCHTHILLTCILLRGVYLSILWSLILIPFITHSYTYT